MRKKFFHLAFLASLIMTPMLFFAADGDIHTWTGMGSRRDTVEMKLNEPTVGSAASLIPGANNTNDLGNSSMAWQDIYVWKRIRWDTQSTSISTATTSGNSRGNFIYAYLGGVHASAEGSLLIATTSVSGFSVIVATNTADQTGWVGIAAAVTAVGAYVPIYTSGWCLALTTGTVAAGDVLVSTTNGGAGYLGKDITPTTGADVGVALAGGTASGGLTLIQLR